MVLTLRRQNSRCSYKKNKKNRKIGQGEGRRGRRGRRKYNRDWKQKNKKSW